MPDAPSGYKYVIQGNRKVLHAAVSCHGLFGGSPDASLICAYVRILKYATYQPAIKETDPVADVINLALEARPNVSWAHHTTFSACP